MEDLFTRTSSAETSSHITSSIPGVYRLNWNSRVLITAGKDGGYHWDNDGTLIDSEEPIYAGNRGCYAMTIQAILQRYDISFSPADWDRLNLKECLGNGLVTDCLKLGRVLSALYPVASASFNLSQLVSEVTDYQNRKARELVANTSLIDGVQEALTRCSQIGSRIGVASAAPQVLVNAGLDHHNIKGHFQWVVTDVNKRLESGHFTSEAATRSCTVGNVDRRGSVFIGDSLSDVGTAALAGLCLAVIVTRERDLHRVECGIQSKFTALHGADHINPNSCRVLLVPSYNQLYFLPSTGEARASFVCLSTTSTQGAVPSLSQQSIHRHHGQNASGPSIQL